MSGRREFEDFIPKGKLPFGAIIIIGLILLALTRSFFTIDAGHGGVLFEPLSGGVDTEKTYGEGLHFKMPWNKVEEYETRMQELTEDMPVLSSNGLDIKVNLSCQVHPEFNKLGFLHQEKGKDYIRRVVLPALRSATRSVIGRYTPEELYSTKREAIESEIFDESAKILERQYVVVERILVKDVSLPDKIKMAIENKLKQEQESLEYEFRIQKAQKEAERKKIEAQGIQEFQTIVSRSITPALLKWKGVEATEALSLSQNSKVVIIGGGDGGLPVILNAE
jgi:regulator of protease activity HflC (stomatin/prohibitin superfamily)